MKFIATTLALIVAQAAAFTVPAINHHATALDSSTSPYDAPAATSSLNIWDKSIPIKVQGGALKTWSFTNPPMERVQVSMRTDGRPLESMLELWEGPDNTPQKIGIYIEEGSMRPFTAVIETPRPGQNAIAIYNTGYLEFPLDACVEADNGDGASVLGSAPEKLAGMSIPKLIQGGSLNTYPFAPSVESVQVLLRTDGRPLNARVELLQGPSNNKQVMEVYTEDGLERPFFAVIETPGVGNVIRVVNKAPVEFPLTAHVEPYLVEAGSADTIADSWENGEGSSFLLSPPM
eukprot:CAMPEP_0202478812 /NCGR_PEP_ID=MMETSP1360-20130828/94655_1 /ASSEMBLY_ACC=CAM_ASM_000848 /TAXON_ID=515479 /ORGANISM="Licmophora paradoxa, Strain CCMP2313" /LENGTH=289 /DNA_ID=CAMNT_0049106107 /DNA_START=858 /DNA_END=1727 /DNA_ORIENTATION=-